MILHNALRIFRILVGNGYFAVFAHFGPKTHEKTRFHVGTHGGTPGEKRPAQYHGPYLIFPVPILLLKKVA